MTTAFAAMAFVRDVHATQVRKYTRNPYIDHLAEVAGIVATVNADEDAIAAAWLHDCVEDQGVTEQQLLDLFGSRIAGGVMLLSDLERGNRAARMLASVKRLATAPAWIQSIKCADVISNTSSIVTHDPNFARVYLREKRARLEVLTRADERLHRLASALVSQQLS